MENILAEIKIDTNVSDVSESVLNVGSENSGIESKIESPKKQLVTQFTRHLTVPQQQRYHSTAQHTLQLSQSSRLLPDKKSASDVWQCSTSLFSLPCFYEFSNQAFLTTSALLLDIPRDTAGLCNNRYLGGRTFE